MGTRVSKVVNWLFQKISTVKDRVAKVTKPVQLVEPVFCKVDPNFAHVMVGRSSDFLYAEMVALL